MRTADGIKALQLSTLGLGSIVHIWVNTKKRDPCSGETKDNLPPANAREIGNQCWCHDIFSAFDWVMAGN